MSFCVKLYPDLIQNYERWKASGIEIYSVPINNDHDIWKGFLKEPNSMDKCDGYCKQGYD